MRFLRSVNIFVEGLSDNKAGYKANQNIYLIDYSNESKIQTEANEREFSNEL